jgi:Domain of unknown function (DUF4258)
MQPCFLRREDRVPWLIGRGVSEAVRWTAHALAALVDRNIDRAEVEQTIVAPELSVIDPMLRLVLMRRYFDVGLGREMLLRVVVEETPDERVVITVY